MLQTEDTIASILFVMADLGQALGCSNVKTLESNTHMCVWGQWAIAPWPCQLISPLQQTCIAVEGIGPVAGGPTSLCRKCESALSQESGVSISTLQCADPGQVLSPKPCKHASLKQKKDGYLERGCGLGCHS